MMTEEKPKSIFRNVSSLAVLFTPENWLVDNKHYEFHDEDWPGMDAMEAFVNDIRCNLIVWATAKRYIAYETKKWRYLAEIKTAERIVTISRFSKTSYQRWDTWLNVPSAASCIGSGFLKAKGSKRIERIV